MLSERYLAPRTFAVKAGAQAAVFAAFVGVSALAKGSVFDSGMSFSVVHIVLKVAAPIAFLTFVFMFYSACTARVRDAGRNAAWAVAVPFLAVIDHGRFVPFREMLGVDMDTERLPYFVFASMVLGLSLYFLPRSALSEKQIADRQFEADIRELRRRKPQRSA